jgi:hypothetical protein
VLLRFTTYFVANRQTPANVPANLQAGLNRNFYSIVQLWIAAALRNAASVSASAGKNVSSASSDKVTSTGVPNTVVVLMKARVPASVTSCSGMADAATIRIDVSAILGPDFGDQLAAPLGISFIPRREISDDQFVYVTHIIISFELRREIRLAAKVFP